MFHDGSMGGPPPTPTAATEAAAAPHDVAISELHSCHGRVARAQRDLLDAIRKCDRLELWRDDGCRDTAQWLSARLGISNWIARRYVNAAHALPHLPRLAAAFETGLLSLDKTVELCRFATPETEKKLISWARRVTVAGVRRKADVANRPDKEEVVEADRTRYLRYWWFEEGTRLGLEGSLPADQGALVAAALDRGAGRVPDVVSDDSEQEINDEDSLDARRADALVAMASRQVADDADAERATVVVHAEVAALAGDGKGCEIEGGPVIHPETARRLSCDARMQVVLHGSSGEAIGIGRMSRTVPPWLLRQLRHRDRGCTFPGCESRRFLHAHHVVHWARGGTTDLDNLVLVCSFHHKLVHEHGWCVELERGIPRWFRLGGRRFEPGTWHARGERAPPARALVAIA